jgi:D-tyrosyl-tRNA(Tyr) deacylase
MAKPAVDKNALELGKIVANKIHERYCQDLTKKEIKEIEKDTDAYIDQIFLKVKNQKSKSK